MRNQFPPIRLFVFPMVFALLAGCQPPTPPEPSTTDDDPALRLEELTYTDIDALDRERTVFLLTFGNLEEHGPHLPIGSDYYQAIALRDGLVEELSQRHPDYTFVNAPVFPLGEGGFNDMARQFEHPGAFGIRFETLRDLTVDFGAAIARKGFKNIFIVHFHGSPFHSVAFTQAAGFVSERYDARMVNISSLMLGEELHSQSVLTKHLGEEGVAEIGMTGHAGTAETSTNLHLHDLVKPEYKALPLFFVGDPFELGRIYEREGFLGYMSDPSRATAAMGSDLMQNFIERATRFAEKALAGEDLSELPMWPDVLPPIEELDASMRMVSERYAQEAAELDAWLQQEQAPHP